MKKAEKVLRDIEKKAKPISFSRLLKGKSPLFISHFIIGPKKGQILVDIIQDVKPKRILEVGTGVGYSSILMGKELLNDAQIITIEINSTAVVMAKANIKRAKIPPTVEVLVGKATEIIPTLTGEFDMVFLDAVKSEYITYLKLLEPHLHIGSTIIADNVGVFAFRMQQYLNYVRRSGKYHSRYIPVDRSTTIARLRDGLEVSVKL
jgi:predicted O-methyltransferase YrrM